VDAEREMANFDDSALAQAILDRDFSDKPHMAAQIGRPGTGNRCAF